MTDQSFHLLKTAVQLRAAAEDKIEQILKHDFAPGTAVRWRLSENTGLQLGRVTMNCYGDRLQVQNTLTGKKRFIRAAQIC